MTPTMPLPTSPSAPRPVICPHCKKVLNLEHHFAMFGTPGGPMQQIASSCKECSKLVGLNVFPIRMPEPTKNSALWMPPN